MNRHNVTRYDAPRPFGLPTATRRDEADFAALEARLAASEQALVNAMRELAGLRAQLTTAQAQAADAPAAARPPEDVADARGAARAGGAQAAKERMRRDAAAQWKRGPKDAA